MPAAGELKVKSEEGEKMLPFQSSAVRRSGNPGTPAAGPGSRSECISKMTQIR
jgi:hypothetical protein